MMTVITVSLSSGRFEGINFDFGRGDEMTRYTLTSAISIVLVLTVFVISPGWAQKRDPSLRQLQEAVKNNPNDPRLHYLMGLKYQN